MKNIIIAAFAVLSMVSCGKKIEAKGPVTTEEMSVSATSNSIRVEAAMKLSLSEDVAEGEIKIITNENIHNYIDVVSNGSQIEIDLENGRYKKLDIEVVASSRQFNNLKASGASYVSVSGSELSFSDYNIELSGASKVNFDSVVNVVSCGVNASGASTVSGRNLKCETLVANLSGASYLEMEVSKIISGNLSGASDLNYWGDAVTSVDCSGSSSVNRK